MCNVNFTVELNEPLETRTPKKDKPAKWRKSRRNGSKIAPGCARTHTHLMMSFGLQPRAVDASIYCCILSLLYCHS